MGEVRGGGNFRAIVAELKDEIVVIRRLLPDDHEPSEVELDQLAHAYQYGSTKDGEPGNGGVPVTCRVVGYQWVGPFATRSATSSRRHSQGCRRRRNRRGRAPSRTIPASVVVAR
jgi:hypothetical protein